jgi:hypothetical protein
MNNADITGDGVVDVQDLTAVILAWGVCPIANDTCATATSVTGGSFGFNNIGADTDGVAFNCGAGFHDVWWTYVAEDDGVLNLDTCGSSFDTILEVFAGTGCPSGALIGCNDDAVSGSCAGSMQSSVSVDVQAGDPVLIRVGGVGGAEGTGTLNVTLAEDVLPPPNDDCADAIDLATNVPFTGTTNGATASSEAGLCGPPVTGPGVWFTVTGTGGELQATLCGAADFDTLLTIYCGPCGNIRCVLGDDDGCGSPRPGRAATRTRAWHCRPSRMTNALMRCRSNSAILRTTRPVRRPMVFRTWRASGTVRPTRTSGTRTRRRWTVSCSSRPAIRRSMTPTW